MKDKLTVLVALDTTGPVLERLHRISPGAEIRVSPFINREGQQIDPALAKGVNALLCELPPANFDDLDQIKWIQLTSAGYQQVLHLPILERHIRVTNGLGNFDGPIAQWNIMMMLMWHREMLEQLENQKNRIFNRTARYQNDLCGSVVGFWGYGGIARETARLAKAMQLKVHVMTRDGKTRSRPLVYRVEGTGDPEGVLPDELFDPSRVKDFLGSVDYLVLGTPLTAQTRGLIGEKELRMLKPSAVVINPTRAQVIDEDAFLRCLKEKWIRGASVDVHYAYPLPPEHPMWAMPNVIMTPHISGSGESPHFAARIYDIFSQNLERFIAGLPLLNELTEAQLRGQ